MVGKQRAPPSLPVRYRPAQGIGACNRPFLEGNSTLGAAPRGENRLQKPLGDLCGLTVVGMLGGGSGEPYGVAVARKITAAIRARLQVRFQVVADADGKLVREILLQELDELLAGHGSSADEMPRLP